MNPIAFVYFKAKSCLDSGQLFICQAIKSLIVSQEVNPIDGIVALQIILDRLEGFNTLESWIDNKHQLPNLPLDQFRVKMTETRKQWLDSLISEFQNESE